MSESLQELRAQLKRAVAKGSIEDARPAPVLFAERPLLVLPKYQTPSPTPAPTE